MVYPESRMRASDLPGRAFDSGGRGRHAMESEVGPKRQEAIAFAREVSERLASARVQGEVERLILVAAPEFLGLLRRNLSAETQRLVEAEYHLESDRYESERDPRAPSREAFYHNLAVAR